MMRRGFLKAVLAVAGASAVELSPIGQLAKATQAEQITAGGVPVLRCFNSAGETVQAFGLGPGMLKWLDLDGGAMGVRLVGSLSFTAIQVTEVKGVEVCFPYLPRGIPLKISDQPFRLVSGDTFTIIGDEPDVVPQHK